MARFTGKIALITGVARGQGASHALRLAQEGADIIGLDLLEPIETAPYEMPTRDDLDSLAQQIEALGRRAVLRKADVRELDQVEAAVAEGVSELGGLDIVVSNAGIVSVSALDELTPREWAEMIDINLTGTWNVLKATIPKLREGGNGGSVVLIASGAGLTGIPNLGHYNASKHGVIGLMRTAALELGPQRIRCNAVCPGHVDTEMIQNPFVRKLFLPELESPTRADGEAPDSPYSESNVMPTPWVSREDVTSAVLFLSSEAARYITGVALPVDAGWLIKS